MLILFLGHSELSSDLQMPGVMYGGQPQRTVSLYENIVTYLCGFVASASPSEFLIIEKLLMENILQTNIWKALLVMDVWCILSR